MNAEELERLRSTARVVLDSGASECAVSLGALMDLLKHAAPDECRQNRHRAGERKVTGDHYRVSCVWCGTMMGGGFASREAFEKHLREVEAKREERANREDACPECEGTGECHYCDGGGECENCDGEG